MKKRNRRIWVPTTYCHCEAAQQPWQSHDYKKRRYIREIPTSLSLLGMTASIGSLFVYRDVLFQLLPKQSGRRGVGPYKDGGYGRMLC